MTKGKIPIYSLNQFKKDPVHSKHYQVEIFDRNRNFHVEYPHRHDNFYELLLITKGSGTYTIDFRSYPLQAGSIYFVSPGQVHTIEYSEDVYGYIFLFTAEFYQPAYPDKGLLNSFPFFHSLTTETPPLILENPEELEALFALTLRESVKGLPHTENLVRSSLDLILNLCLSRYPVSAGENSKSKGRLLVRQFKELINQHYTKNHGVQEYAGMLAVTANHLNETVKQFTGITAKEHIKERMLLEAKRLLSHTELNISEIGWQLGFEDQSYFSRFFRKCTGFSPNEFREETEKKLNSNHS